MINGKSILSIIPARGGSKGIPRKNLKTIAGKPLIAWTIEEAKKSRYIDRTIISSEDEEIIEVAKEYGGEVPFIRPKELAQDDTPGIEPVIHVVIELKEEYDYVCLLQPTSPLRKVVDIDGCIQKCVFNNVMSCVSVSEVDKHPYWMYKLGKYDRLVPLFKGKYVTRRQDLPKIYALNGAIYMINSHQILQMKKIVTDETLCHVMDKTSSVDIDTNDDFDIAEYFLNKRMTNG